ncbi:hypothetical protein AVEN_271010-1 [Araneus ventricosus]|uniref:RNase H type-1 domain-containing protein n=1 Tax=Araneus ventricosus TaxID=182803 RepID=A0A4Y2NJP6_ARAVE|nr:hypothetical protein AVEN_271010-1 [Araneus ventricosus]
MLYAIFHVDILCYYDRLRMYGVWLGSSRPTVLRRLDTIHHSPLRICSGAFRTSPVESLFFTTIAYQYPSFVPIFTDGSKSDGHVGCGVAFPSNTLSYRLHNCCSVFTAELVAIFRALQEISLSNQCNFIIYTDSMSSLKALSHYDNRMRPVALDILSILQFLRNEGFNIICCWIPSHVGISGNETADTVAKFASAFLPRPFPYCDIKKFLLSHLSSVWQQKWDPLINNKLHSVKPSISLWSVLPI